VQVQDVDDAGVKDGPLDGSVHRPQRPQRSGVPDATGVATKAS
jgi:hypothetical protein